MKKFTSLLIGVSLALAGAAFAQQPEEQSTPGPGKKQGTEKTQHGEKGIKGTGINARTSPSATPAAAATASAAPSVAATGQQTAGGNAAVKADPQKVQQVKQQAQQIKQQHANFRAQPRPDKVPAVTFNASYRIQGSDRWQGSQYEVFRSYHPERHDRNWYHARYQRVELVGRGCY